jgi:hypothetical protein
MDTGLGGDTMGSRAIILVVVGAAQIGCYNYTPLGRSSLVPSTYLAVTLTESGSEELAPSIGPSMLIVRGRFLSTTERGLILSVATVENRRGDLLAWNGESVVIPGEFVRSVETRQTAAGKTVLLAGTALVGMLAAYAAFGQGAGATTSGGVASGPSPH